MASYANGVIPNINVGITDVRQTLGLSNTEQWNSLGWLCAGARLGGRNGVAFNISEVENRPEYQNGEWTNSVTIPYFNIWSNNSPGEWFYKNIPNTGDEFNLVYQLKRGTYKKYLFGLHHFRGYKHKSIPAHMYITASTKEYWVDESTDGITVSGYYDVGEYDWSKVFGGENLFLKIDSNAFASTPVPLSQANKQTNFSFKIPNAMLSMNLNVRASMSVYRENTRLSGLFFLRDKDTSKTPIQFTGVAILIYKYPFVTSFSTKAVDQSDDYRYELKTSTTTRPDKNNKNKFNVNVSISEKNMNVTAFGYDQYYRYERNGSWSNVIPMKNYRLKRSMGYVVLEWDYELDGIIPGQTNNIEWQINYGHNI